MENVSTFLPFYQWQCGDKETGIKPPTLHQLISLFSIYIQTYALIKATYPHTFIGTSYPLQRGDIIIMLANREGEDTDLDGGEKRIKRSRRQNEQPNNVLQRQNTTTQTFFWMAISSMSCDNCNTKILSMIQLSSQSTHTNISNTRIQ